MANHDITLVISSFLRILADEVENNNSLAKKLAAPFYNYLNQQQTTAFQSNKKTKPKKNSITIPEGFDPFVIYYEKGGIGLLAALADKDAAICKAILSHFALDPTRSYTRWRKQEKLADFIVQRVKAMSSRGKVFLEENG